MNESEGLNSYGRLCKGEETVGDARRDLFLCGAALSGSVCDSGFNHG